MTAEEFNLVLTSRIEKIQKTLRAKATEYATTDRLYNFKEGAKVLRSNKFHTLLAYLTKHIVSVYDLAEKAGQGQVTPKPVYEEKIGDAINYLILLEAMLAEPPETLNQQIRQIPDKELKEMLNQIERGPDTIFCSPSPTPPPIGVGQLSKATITKSTVQLPRMDAKGRVCVVPPNVFVCQDVNGEFFYHDPITKLPTPAYVFQKPNEP